MENTNITTNIVKLNLLNVPRELFHKIREEFERQCGKDNDFWDMEICAEVTPKENEK